MSLFDAVRASWDLGKGMRLFMAGRYPEVLVVLDRARARLRPPFTAQTLSMVLSIAELRSAAEEKLESRERAARALEEGLELLRAEAADRPKVMEIEAIAQWRQRAEARLASLRPESG